ncbi:MAG: cardiolipin synthase [Clostridia bacterium]
MKNITLKKSSGEKKLLLTISKIVAVILLIFLQIAVMTLFYTTARNIYNYARIVYDIVRIAMVLHLLYRHDSVAYKISWMLFILFMPVVGMLVYLLWGNSKLRRKKEKEFKKIRCETMSTLYDCSSVKNEIKAIDKYKYNQVEFTSKITGYPIYKNQGIKYFKNGEEYFCSFFEDLKKAQKYILLEFYILSSGKLWDKTLEILKEKVKNGVKVQIIIDSLGCIFRKPKSFIDKMSKYGIQIYIFNPFTPLISGYINYRDHRKIVVIDGIIAYTGGINLADEYANIIERFGYWKDVGIKVEGNAAWSFTLMFLRAMQSINNVELDYMWYKNVSNNLSLTQPSIGYVHPFADGPDNRKNPLESVFIQTINYAKDYVYITTPYFVVSESVLNALLNSARGGVDVRVIFPHIPDKKLVQVVTRSFYEVLLEAGVKVYEYKPGFIHSKTFVADDDTSIVGSANLDFRSMHLNFESLLWSYKTGEEKMLKKDFKNMLTECVEIDIDEWLKRPFYKKILEAIMSAFAPML